MIVYKAENKINGKVYIGKTIQPLEQRISRHINGKGAYFHSAIKKYGINSFVFSVIDSAETDIELCKKEIYWIKNMKSRQPYGYNLTDGGDGTVGRIQSDETKNKISMAHKGKTNKRLAEWNKKNWKGKHHSEEIKKKIGEGNLGKRMSLEARMKLSEKAKTRILSEITKAKISRSLMGRPYTEKMMHVLIARNKSRAGIKHTSEHNRKISESGKGRKHSEETKIKMSQSATKLWGNRKYGNQ